MLCRKYSVGQNSHTGTDPKAGEDTRASPACIGLCPHCTIPPPSPPLRCRHPRAHFPSQDHDKPRGKDLSLIHLGIQPKLTTQMALLDGGFYRILQTCFYLCFNRWCCSVTQSCPTLWDPWTAACQASLFFIISRSLLKLISTELVMPSTHLILCLPLLLLPSVFPSIRVFSNELALRIRWPKYWSFSFSISPSNEYSELISFRIDWFDLLAVQGTLKSLLQHHNLKASNFQYLYETKNKTNKTQNKGYFN